MFEKHSQPLLPLSSFVLRLVRNLIFGILIVAIALFIGMLGYAHYEKMSWVDAFLNAAMILSGMGPAQPLLTNSGKIFAGFFAIFSGLAFILILGIVFAPVVHRFLHRFHLADENSEVHTRRSHLN